MKTRQQEESLFEAARLLTSQAARAAFLDQACADQPELRASLEALLSEEAEADKFFEKTSPKSENGSLRQRLESGTAQESSNHPTGNGANGAEGLGTRIGNYKLLQKIGEGGCGIVYMAEQDRPIRRRVALKIIKLGMDTKNVIARFEAERQALAMMDHLNIARVFEAGATETGRPYFVMELVRGIRLTDYCDQNHLDTKARLKLFIQVCQAIQHAHQKGIIHRDIKPSNILVTLHDGVPVPKVIDFGIAKAIEIRLTDKTLFTAYEQMVGTPAYMSPEQAEMSGLDVDTRSDIYSLGVLLYELLTGRPPFDPKKLVQGGLDEMRRTLREREPQRPSTMITTLQGADLTAIAEHHGAELPKLISSLRGDLDWIVMRALEKDRNRRYETANGLAMDIGRYLNSEPVVARPPSRTYRFWKLVRRNKATFAAGLAVALALLAGMGASTVLLIAERQARQHAVAAEKKANELRHEAELREKFTQMTLLITQEKYKQADALLVKTESANGGLHKPSLEGATVLRSLGEWYARQGNWKMAAKRFSQLLKVDKLDGWDVITLDYLECGPVYIELHDWAGYERFRQAAVQRFANTTYPVADRILKISLLRPADQQLLNALRPLANTTLQTFQGSQTGVQSDPFRAAWQCISLGLMEYRSGNYVEAVDWCRRCLAYREYVAPRTATAQVIMAMALQKLHKTDAAQAELAKGKKIIEAKFATPLDHGSAPNGFWFDWIFGKILMQEAQGFIPSH